MSASSSAASTPPPEAGDVTQAWDAQAPGQEQDHTEESPVYVTTTSHTGMFSIGSPLSSTRQSEHDQQGEVVALAGSSTQDVVHSRSVMTSIESETQVAQRYNMYHP